MKLLFDFFPIVLFFVAFKFYGIYVATAVTMAASFLQVSLYWLKHRRFEKMHLVTLTVVLIFGGSTLIFHNDLFIKWKPTVIYWVFAVSFIISQYVGKQNLTQRMLGGQITLPPPIWQRLNHSWIIFFSLMGIINVYVLYNFSTNAWVNFKLFGALGMMVAFLIVQMMYISRYLEAKNDSTPLSTLKPLPDRDEK